MFEAAPKIEIPRKLHNGSITLKQGEDLNVSLTVSGKPTPFWVWEFTPEGHQSSSELPDCGGHSNKAMLKVKKVNRQKRGVYSLHCWNEFGEDRKDFTIEVQGIFFKGSSLTFSRYV